MPLLSFSQSELATGMTPHDEPVGPKRKPFYMYLPLLGAHAVSFLELKRRLRIMLHNSHFVPNPRAATLATHPARAVPLHPPPLPPEIPAAPRSHLHSHLLHPYLSPRLCRAGPRTRRV